MNDNVMVFALDLLLELAHDRGCERRQHLLRPG